MYHPVLRVEVPVLEDLKFNPTFIMAGEIPPFQGTPEGDDLDQHILDGAMELETPKKDVLPVSVRRGRRPSLSAHCSPAPQTRQRCGSALGTRSSGRSTSSTVGSSTSASTIGSLAPSGYVSSFGSLPATPHGCAQDDHTEEDMEVGDALVSGLRASRIHDGSSTSLSSVSSCSTDSPPLVSDSSVSSETTPSRVSRKRRNSRFHAASARTPLQQASAHVTPTPIHATIAAAATTTATNHQQNPSSSQSTSSTVCNLDYQPGANKRQHSSDVKPSLKIDVPSPAQSEVVIVTPTAVTMVPTATVDHPLQMTVTPIVPEQATLKNDPTANTTNTTTAHVTNATEPIHQLNLATKATVTATAANVPAPLTTSTTTATDSHSHSQSHSRVSSRRHPRSHLPVSASRGPLISVLSCVLEQLFSNPNDTLPTDPRQISMFHTERIPSISIGQYLDRIAYYSECSEEALVMAFIHISRIYHSNTSGGGGNGCHPAAKGFQLNTLSIHRLLLVAIMSAAKFWDDSYYNNAFYGKIGGVATRELNALEVEFLALIAFELYIPSKIYKRFYTELTNPALHPNCRCAYRLLPPLVYEDLLPSTPRHDCALEELSNYNLPERINVTGVRPTPTYLPSPITPLASVHVHTCEAKQE